MTNSSRLEGRPDQAKATQPRPRAKHQNAYDNQRRADAVAKIA